MFLSLRNKLKQIQLSFTALLTAVATAWTSGYLFGKIKIVDPVHHKIYFSTADGINLACFILPLMAACVYLFRKYKATPGPGGLICAAAAAFLTLFPGFTTLAASLLLLSFSLWLSFPHRHHLKNSRYWIILPILLFIYVFANGFEQQQTAYNRLILLYFDWGIYFDGYRQLAENTFTHWGTWFSIGNHWNFAVNLFMAGVIYLFPGIQTVFIVNSLALASGVLLIFLLGKCLKVPDILCALCSFAAAFNPLLSNQHTALMYGYHPIVFLLPAALSFCIAKEKKSTPGMILSGIFLCGIKETVFIFTFGAAFIFAFRRMWKTSAATAFISAGLFVLVTQVLLPRCDGTGKFFQMFQYHGLGDSMGEVLLSPLHSPLIFWSKIFRPGNLSFVLLLLLPVIPFALFAPEFLFALLPLLGGVLLKDSYDDKINIVQQYGFEITVFLLLAMVYGTAGIHRRKKFTCGMTAAVLAGCMTGYFFYGKTPIFGTYSATPARNSPDVRIIREQLKKIIPSDAVVAVSQKWAGQLVDSHRKLSLTIDDEKADFRILDFADSFLPRDSAMRLRDRLRKEQTEYPVSMFNLRGCRILVFKKGKGSWKLPFIIQGSPEKLMPDGKIVETNHPDIKARAILLTQRRKILIFFGNSGNANYDAELSITLHNHNQRQFYTLNWGYGVYPAYAMNANQSFAAELPIPGNWDQITGLNITVKTYNKPSTETKK